MPSVRRSARYRNFYPKQRCYRQAWQPVSTISSLKARASTTSRTSILTLPRNQLIVVTGLSGSGKSSLAFDTIYAEGQRRYVESLSSYARQFLGQMEKPDVDYIEGLSPAISIDQKSTSRNPRSTVGTVTEVYDYLRLLYARVGTPHCYNCGREISSQSSEQIVDSIMELPEGTKIQVLAPLVRGRKGEYAKLFEEVAKEGFARVRVDGEVKELREKITLDKKRKHTIEVVVDRLVMKPEIRKRLTDSVETTLRLSTGIVTVLADRSRAHVQRSIRVRVLRYFVRGACSAPVLLQLAVRRVPGVHRPGREDRDRSLESDSRSQQIDRRRRDRAVEQESRRRPLPIDESVLSPAARARDAQAPREDDDADRSAFRQRARRHSLRDREGRRFRFHLALRARRGSTIVFRRRDQQPAAALQPRRRATMSKKTSRNTCRPRRARPARARGSSPRRSRSRSAITTSTAHAHVDREREAFFRDAQLTPRQEQIAHQIVKEVRARLGFLTNVG